MTQEEAGSAGAQLSEDSLPRKTSWIFVALGLLVIIAGAWLASENLRLRSALLESSPAATSGNSTLKPGDFLPDVKVVELSRESGGQQASGSLLGKLDGPTVLFFFTSTCPYCARSFPFARVLQEQLGGLSVDVVGVALDRRLPAREDSGLAAVNYRALAPVDLAAAKDFRVALVPTLLLVDRDFDILAVWTGELTASRVEEVARSVLGMSIPGD